VPAGRRRGARSHRGATRRRSGAAPADRGPRPDARAGIRVAADHRAHRGGLPRGADAPRGREHRGLIAPMASADQPAPLLRQRNFAALWWGQLISIVGDRLTYLALGGLL